VLISNYIMVFVERKYRMLTSDFDFPNLGLRFVSKVVLIHRSEAKLERNPRISEASRQSEQHHLRFIYSAAISQTCRTSVRSCEAGQHPPTNF
jgi:hypothetical protein